MDYQLRNAHEDDAEAVSKVILQALRETNAQDYPPAIIAQVQHSFSPQAVAALIRQRQVFVALAGDRVVGTASLDANVVRTVFVTPDLHGQGIGRLLMSRVEQVAREGGIEVLTIPSSVTAEQFYAKLGFKVVRENYHGEERTLIMERSLLSR